MQDRDRDRLAPEVAELKSLAVQLNERAARLASHGLHVELETSTVLCDAGSRSVLSVRVFEEWK
jgi:hypothetical protein